MINWDDRQPSKPILVACIGNIFFGDDAFGVAVAQALTRRPLPEAVRLVDFGIRGFDLVYALMEGYEAVILVDTVTRGEPPGTLFVIEPEVTGISPNPGEMVEIETHGLNPFKALEIARSFGAELKKILLVGCEPASLGAAETGEMGLSPPVAEAVPEAAGLIEALLEKLLQENSLVRATPSNR